MMLLSILRKVILRMADEWSSCSLTSGIANDGANGHSLHPAT
jgi:hypothetical protein